MVTRPPSRSPAARGAGGFLLPFPPRGGLGGDGGGARAREGPGAPDQGGAPEAAAGDRAAGRRGTGRRALRRPVRLVVLPPRQCQPKESQIFSTLP